MDPPFLLAAAIAIAVQLCHLRKIEASFSSHGDKISLLPGQPQVGFQQYAGYVTVDDRKHKTLFYYFVEAEVDPASKSLVLWLNGGPGCSSIGVGAFSENGPFRPKGEILVKNEHSWNGEANMLYLETPVGVGFSYAADTTAYSAVSDEMTGGDVDRNFSLVLPENQSIKSGPSDVPCDVAICPLVSTKARDNLIFLQRWFDKFPQYRHRDLFITGESYAGHYVPQLAMLMIQFNEKHKLFNLKGIALGNPVLEFATDFNSRAEYFWSHGLISDSTYSMFTSICNYSRYVSEYYRDSVSPVCSRVMAEVSRETSRFVDKYDVTLDVCMSSVLSQSKIINPQGEVSEAVDVCVEDETVNYLNRQDVQKALHARLINVRKWAVCSNILDYVLLDVEIPTISIIGLLIKRGVQVLVYSGDQDSVIPLTGSRTLVQQLARDLGLNTTIPYRAWFAGQQVGGWMEAYGDVLSFATIRGASHEAPFSQPERSLVLFKSFLEGRPLPAMF